MHPASIRALRYAAAVALLGPLACGEPSATVSQAPPAAPVQQPRMEPTPEPVAPEAQTVLPRTPPDFEAATTIAAELFANQRKTFFCGCTYTPDMRTAWGACGYQTRADDALAKHATWERIVPIGTFGSHRACWRLAICNDEEGTPFSGVRCCREQDLQFAAMENDLFNVVPAIAEVSQDRSNYPFGEIEGEARMYGGCDFEIDRANGVAEPSDAIRGDIARTYLYMHEVYGEGLPLTMRELQIFRTWHEVDPPDELELQRAAAIVEIQGIAHPLLPVKAP
jgi:deoxyribonuclease-1